MVAVFVTKLPHVIEHKKRGRSYFSRPNSTNSRVGGFELNLREYPSGNQSLVARDDLEG